MIIDLEYAHKRNLLPVTIEVPGCGELEGVICIRTESQVLTCYEKDDWGELVRHPDGESFSERSFHLDSAVVKDKDGNVIAQW